MATRFAELAAALETALTSHLATITGLAIDRRLTPRLDRAEFAPDKFYLSIFLGSGSWEIFARQVDKQEWEVVLALQAAVPEPAPAVDGNPFATVTSVTADPVSWGDAVLEIGERIKDLWRAETSTSAAGPLRSLMLAGCDFTGLVHEPVYVPEHLTELGILTSVIVLTYRVDDPDAD